MGNMDELHELWQVFNGEVAADEDEVGCDEPKAPIQVARRQLGESRVRFYEDGEGVFRFCGNHHGVGFIEGVIVVSDQTGLASVDLNANQRVAPERIPAVRKLFRRFNAGFIVPGLAVDDEGWIHFHPKDVDLAAGNDLAGVVNMGLSTLHAHASVACQVEVGRSTWKVFHTIDDDD